MLVTGLASFGLEKVCCAHYQNIGNVATACGLLISSPHFFVVSSVIVAFCFIPYAIMVSCYKHPQKNTEIQISIVLIM
jgi:hypothetical protein